MSTRIDQPSAPAGRYRCIHDMLDGECAWCKGLPDIRIEDQADRAEQRGRWVHVEHRGVTCLGCDTDLILDARALWSVEVGGLVCIECAEGAS